MEKEYQKLLSGVDTFYFGVEFEKPTQSKGEEEEYGENPYEQFLGEWTKTLDKYKNFAREGQKSVLKIQEQTFQIRKSGRQNYKWILQNSNFSLALSSIYSPNYPQVYVELRSNLILSQGLQWAVDCVYDFLSSWIYPPARIVPSRVDLFLDLTGHSFENEDVVNFLCRSRFRQKTGQAVKTQTYYRQRDITGFAFGRGSKIMARIYNKTWEIKEQSPNKKWLFKVWKGKGWDSEKPVWRVEFQLRREILREFDINSLNGVIDRLDSLWHKLTGQWLSLRAPNKRDNNPSRWQIKPVWSWLTKNFEFGGIERFEVAESFGSLMRLKSGFLGNLTSLFCADKDLKEFSFSALEKLLEEETNRLFRKNFDVIVKMNGFKREDINRLDKIPLEEKMNALIALKEPKYKRFQEYQEQKERRLHPEASRKDING